MYCSPNSVGVLASASRHQRFTMETDIDIYFSDPPSPWQRGSNENTNRLFRQYFPKGTDLAPHPQAEVNR
jgi:IS30 family transposase